MDAENTTTTRTYDALNRALTAVSSRTGVTTETVTWAYDQSAISSFAKGRLTTLGGPEAVVTYRYERRGLLLSETTPNTAVSGGLAITAYTYDSDGNRSSIGYPSNRMRATYTFDYAGRPTAAAGTYLTTGFPGSATATLVSSASYMPFGPVKQIVFGNGTTRTIDYDNRYRVSFNTLAGPAGNLARYGYSYVSSGSSSNNNIWRILDGIDTNFDRQFQYDDLDRLVGAQGGPASGISGPELWGNWSYTYDAMGNMKTASLGEAPVDTTPDILSTDPLARPLSRRTTFTYVGTTPKLDNVAEWGRELPTDPVELRVKSMANLRGRSVAYDAAGNETGYVATRTYSARNLLASVTDESEDNLNPHSVQYGYDGRGVRIRRTETPATETGGPATRNFYYTPELQLLSVSTDDASNLWAANLSTVNPMRYEIIWFGGLPIAQTDSSDSLAAPRYTFTDHLGTPIIQTNATADIIWHAEYEPYGNIYKMRVGERLDQPLRFPGQEVAMTWEGQEENYNIFRWYRSGWGRYTQTDPLGKAAHLSTVARAKTTALEAYGYVSGRPTAATDPLGLWTTAGPADPQANTIVCDGNGGVEIQVPPRNSRRFLCTRDCTVAHESSHRDDALRASPTICAGQLRGIQIAFSSREEHVSSERGAYRTGIECLRERLALGDAANGCCSDELKRQIDFLENLGTSRGYLP